MSGKDVLDIVVQKVVEVLTIPEDLARVLFYLTREQDAYKDTVGPALKMLDRIKYSDSVFKDYVNFLVKDTRTAENNKEFAKIMGIMYSQFMDNKCLEGDETQTPQELTEILERLSIGGGSGFIRALSRIPYQSQLQVINTIGVLAHPSITSSLVRVANTVNKYGVNKITVALAALYLAPKIIKGLREWWNNEISGKRCCKIIIDEFTTAAAGIGGGIVGASLGASLGIFGIIAGGVIGGILSSEVASRFSDWMTQQIFNIPKDAALENAYVYFGVDKNASNLEINEAYRKKCLQHHPDKGGNSEEFHKVQMHMAIIKAARGQLYS